QGDLSLQALRERALALVERPVERDRKEGRGGLGGSGQRLGVGGLQSAPCAGRGVGRQRGCALEEGRGRGDAAARLGAVGRAFQLRGDFLVGTGGGAGAVPGAPIGIPRPVGCLGERVVNPTAVVGGR